MLSSRSSERRVNSSNKLCMRAVLFCAPASVVRLWMALARSSTYPTKSLIRCRGWSPASRTSSICCSVKGSFLDWAKRGEMARTTQTPAMATVLFMTRKQRGILFLEDLHHQLGLHLLQLLQGRLQHLPVVIGGGVENIVQPVLRMPHQLLGILHLLAVLSDAHVDLFRILLDQVQCLRSSLITSTQLLPGELGHLMNQLGIEETLFFGLGLVGLGHEGGHGLRIDNSVIHGVGAKTG